MAENGKYQVMNLISSSFRMNVRMFQSFKDSPLCFTHFDFLLSNYQNLLRKTDGSFAIVNSYISLLISQNIEIQNKSGNSIRTDFFIKG